MTLGMSFLGRVLPRVNLICGDKTSECFCHNCVGRLQRSGLLCMSSLLAVGSRVP